jgi:uncharacterized membrane protein
MLNNAAVRGAVNDAQVYRGLPTGMEPLTMLGKDGTHPLNRERVDVAASAQMGGPIAFNDGQQTGHLGEHGFVGHILGNEVFKTLTCGLERRRPVASTLNFESVNAVHYSRIDSPAQCYRCHAAETELSETKSIVRELLSRATAQSCKITDGDSGERSARLVPELRRAQPMATWPRGVSDILTWSRQRRARSAAARSSKGLALCCLATASALW